MNKITALTAALSVSAIFIAPAHAADLHVSSPAESVVRISVLGKTPAQLAAAIQGAAETVCLDHAIEDTMCVTDAVADANSQLAAINALHRTSAATSLSVIRGGPTTIRIALNGKTDVQVDTEISTAAHTVCENASADRADYDNCVDAAISDARYQLQFVVAQTGQHRVASN
jgi:hypothetical protein